MKLSLAAALLLGTATPAFAVGQLTAGVAPVSYDITIHPDAKALAFSGQETVADAGQFPADGAVIPSEATPFEVAAAQQRLRIAQWVTPVVTAIIIVLGAAQGEQQRPSQVVKGLLHRS